tara:strand:- start:96 stop:293 length:198 start_codon:yes stop_codon:yes gene_type:complete
MNEIQKRFLEKATSSEILDFTACLDQASRAGKTVEVVYSALETINSIPSISPLLAMQIACGDWDV